MSSEAFKPQADMKGQLTATFGMNADLANDAENAATWAHVVETEAEHLKRSDLEYARADMNSDTGRISLGHNDIKNAKSSQNKDKERKKSEIMKLIEDARRALLKDLAKYQADLEKHLGERDEVIDKRKAVESFLEDYRENGEFDVGEDGYPTDEKAKEAIKEWEKKTGKKWDANDPDAAEILMVIIEDYKDQEKILDDKIEEDKNNIENTTELLEKAEIAAKTGNASPELIRELEKHTIVEEKTNTIESDMNNPANQEHVNDLASSIDVNLSF